MSWTFNGQTVEILTASITGDQAVFVTVRTLPYSGGSSQQLVFDLGGVGPETMGMGLWFPTAADFVSFRTTVLGTQGALDWMLGNVPGVMLKSLNLKTLYRPTDHPVEVDAQFAVVSPITGSGLFTNTGGPWSFTLPGPNIATLNIADAAMGDSEDTEVSTRTLPGASGTNPTWYADWGPSGAETIHIALAFDAAADFVNFRLALLGRTGGLVYPVGSVTKALLSKMSVTKVFPSTNYPVLATADFLVITP